VLAKLRSHRPRHSTVVAYLALFVALGGTSYAAIRVTSKNVPKDALTGADIKDLTGADVRNNSLTGADVRSLRSGDIANGSLLPEDFAPGQLPKGEAGAPGPPGPTAGAATGDYDDPPANPQAVLEEVAINMAAPGRIYAQASVHGANWSCTFSGTPQLSGNCTMTIGLYVDGQPVPHSAEAFGNSAASNSSSFTSNIQMATGDRDMSLFGVSAPLSAGTHHVQLSGFLDAHPNNANTAGAVGPNGPGAIAIVGGIALGG
jgi:hypothetical protein